LSKKVKQIQNCWIQSIRWEYCIVSMVSNIDPYTVHPETKWRNEIYVKISSEIQAAIWQHHSMYAWHWQRFHYYIYFYFSRRP
jgi:hypothetical protein